MWRKMDIRDTESHKTLVFKPHFKPLRFAR